MGSRIQQETIDCKFIYDGGCALDPSIEHSVKINDWVGLRPGRDSVRLEKENIDGVSVVHNYGHGGSGITVFKVRIRNPFMYNKVVLSEV